MDGIDKQNLSRVQCFNYVQVVPGQTYTRNNISQYIISWNISDMSMAKSQE